MVTGQRAVLDDEQRADAAMQLRALLGEIYAGRIEVTDVQGAYLAGVLDGLEGRLPGRLPQGPVEPETGPV